MFSNFFSGNRAACEIMSKMWWSQRDRRQYAHARCVLD